MDGRSRWYVAYLVIFGTAAGVLVPMIGLGDRLVRVIAIGLWGVVIVALWIFAARQPVNRRGFLGRHGRVIGLWAAAYGVVLSVGAGSYPGEAAWWIPGGIIVALPAFVAAYRETRR